MSIEWNGEGLPPVGCICEGNFPRFGSLVWKWQDCLVLWRFENECAVRCIHTGILHYCDDFRPTLTDEERKREEAVAALKELKPQLVGQLAGILYDQIAAGKIPHITLK